MGKIEIIQKQVCAKYNVQFVPSQEGLFVGVADNLAQGMKPVNGLRHPPESDGTGWFIWAGQELSDKEDFFKPMHTLHVLEQYPQVLPYLGLPAGWRFLVDGDYADVWYDETLLATE